MQIPSLINRGRNGFNMTPMIDVVFLLIIFFLVASHLSDQDSQIQMDLAEAQSARAVESGLTGRLTINVPEDGRLVYSGESISPERLVALLQEASQENGQDLEVRIRADRRVSYSSISPLLKSCTDVGIWNVTFAVYEKRESP